MLFRDESSVAARQSKTDRLILARLLKDEASKLTYRDEKVAAAHAVLLHWADLEKSGRLARLNETQLQGDFLAQVFGKALEYVQPIAGAESWQQEQHPPDSPEKPDAILGNFTNDSRSVLAVVELKGPTVHLDRDRSGGRTAVDQCWDYLINQPTTCRWGVVSNIVSFRLYERDFTKRAYEHFSLQSLRDIEEFRRFYVLFHRLGLVEGVAGYPPRAKRLLKETNNRQREVSDELYNNYVMHRLSLIEHLRTTGHAIDAAVEMAQRLLDRIVFIAFCEDRNLLPEKTIPKAFSVAGFHAVTNPRWQNFKNLFRFIDQGNAASNIPGYNGGLFAAHAVDELELPDEPWTNFFHSLSTYDFRDEVNLDVLGHLFERSISELEKLKQTALFEGGEAARQRYAQMPQSVKRKQLGIYYTPPELTSRIAQYTVEELIIDRFKRAAVDLGTSEAEAQRGILPDTLDYWRRCLDVLRNLRIVDPACGSGAFLFQAYNVLEQRYQEVVTHLEKHGAADAEALGDSIPHMILGQNLYGVDLSPEAVEITQLALWIRSATPGQTLATLSRNIVHGNSLVHDSEVHPLAFDWRERFPEVFDRPETGFDCVIGNPPWERIDLSEREFFSLPAPEIATSTTGAKRQELVDALEQDNPPLYAKYVETKLGIDNQREYCQESGRYPLTGKGRTNFYAVFAELAYQLVAPNGRVGLLTPSGIASDKTTMDFFAAIAESNRLIRLYDFENKRVFFPEVHASFKFCILNFSGEKSARDSADFVFFAHSTDELDDAERHVALSGADIRLLNPNTRTCPIFRSKCDAEITKAIYRRVPILLDKARKRASNKNPWGVRFLQGLFNQTTDSGLFRDAQWLKRQGLKPQGNRWVKGNQLYLPLYEAKMVQAYDHRAADVVTDEGNWVRQGQTERTTLVNSQNPEHLATPRFWVNSNEVELEVWGSLGFKDITSPTNQRTMIAAFGPLAGYTNHFILIRSEVHPRRQMCLLGNLNSFAYDYCTRQKIAGVTLNFFIVEQIPTFPPETYDKQCPWERKTTLETWISERVLKLTCTAEDMLPLADRCEFTSGSFKREYRGRLNKWDEAERAQLMAELDAAYFHLYGIDRDDAEYILSTFKGIDDRTPLFPENRTTAEHILSLYDELAAQ